MLCGSFSKSVAPGYRVGWLLPGRFFERVKNLKATNTVATATLPQLGLAEYVCHGGYDHHLRSLRHSLLRQVEQTSHAVADCFPPETKLARPQAVSFWVELPKRVDSLRLHARALAEKISIDRTKFSPQQNYRNCIRVSCGQPWSPKIERQLGF